MTYGSFVASMQTPDDDDESQLQEGSLQHHFLVDSAAL